MILRFCTKKVFKWFPAAMSNNYLIIKYLTSQSVKDDILHMFTPWSKTKSMLNKLIMHKKGLQYYQT